MPEFYATIAVKSGDDYTTVNDPESLRQAGAGLMAASAADCILAQLKALPGAGPTVVRQLVGEQRAYFERLLDLALQARKQQHPALAETFTEIPVEVTQSEAVRDSQGRLSKTISRKFTTG